jgi:hypothetical protein
MADKIDFLERILRRTQSANGSSQRFKQLPAKIFSKVFTDFAPDRFRAKLVMLLHSERPAIETRIGKAPSIDDP